MHGQLDFSLRYWRREEPRKIHLGFKAEEYFPQKVGRKTTPKAKPQNHAMLRTTNSALVVASEADPGPGTPEVCAVLRSAVVSFEFTYIIRSISHTRTHTTGKPHHRTHQTQASTHAKENPQNLLQEKTIVCVCQSWGFWLPPP